MVDVNDKLLSNVDDVANSPQNNFSSKENIEVECDLEIPSVPWDELPSLVIDSICSFLSRKDQCSMSQVCHNWREYVLPSLWRNMTFHFPSDDYANSTENTPEYTRKYGHFFQNVRVTCSFWPSSSLETMRRHMSSFFQALACHSKLLSISFKHLKTYLGSPNEEEYEDHRRQCLINALLAQNRLQRVQFEDTLLVKPVAVEILQSIFFGCSKTLKQLILDNFMIEYPEEGLKDTTLDVFFTFETLMNLKTLTINYSEYFVKIITSVYDYGRRLRLQKTGKLETLLLTWDGIEKYSYSIKPAAWIYFRKIFPALRMHVTIIYVLKIRNRLDSFLVRHMPIRAFTILFIVPEIGSMLRLLTECKINECLELLEIKGSVTATDLADGLVNFLQVFSKLRELSLNVRHNPNAGLENQLRTVFEHWHKNRPLSLDTVHISVHASETEEELMFKNLSCTYTPLLKSVGLNLMLRTKTIRPEYDP